MFSLGHEASTLSHLEEYAVRIAQKVFWAVILHKLTLVQHQDSETNKITKNTKLEADLQTAQEEMYKMLYLENRAHPYFDIWGRSLQQTAQE